MRKLKSVTIRVITDVSTPLRQLKVPVGIVSASDQIKISPSNIVSVESPNRIDVLPRGRIKLEVSAAKKTAKAAAIANPKVVTEPIEGLVRCPTCFKSYTNKHVLIRHLHYECQKPPLFQCALCSFRAKQKHMVTLHMRKKHSLKPSQA